MLIACRTNQYDAIAHHLVSQFTRQYLRYRNRLKLSMVASVIHQNLESTIISLNIATIVLLQTVQSGLSLSAAAARDHLAFQAQYPCWYK